MGCVLASGCHHAVVGGDADDVDEVILPWPEDVNASPGYPHLIMSEPAVVYMLAERGPVAIQASANVPYICPRVAIHVVTNK